ncbi:hypothetical protein A3A05_01485 [Candidatus Nomurabacteria bacterium RIFCSPLOWO2_01_FULL_41_12]|uniref:Uncharacterized protein n=1 Tax=Candidatus Nomurabacteria bacterium RIFCSPLOWO2_01_FULL_41_12 TaxID=1801774 RepID=A0A1F6WW31_9BACT|nr:MAG: hypothetical protein A2732_00465 [Candidatus Nomurabacteria bacterium RIFCSPHIGHO2_01_FULL_40_10]OGI86069.1 MAG: hypothetical protein A3A05_01485 [Candidatus Nomurabacteria bacterium RIFCSPLOWO2_01_FULL_41_12]
MKKFYITLLLALSLLPVCRIYAQATNAGFVPGNIWYSIDPFEEGDRVKIYTVLFNPDQREFSGTVIFFDKATFLGKKEFAVGSRGVKDISIDWTATVGDHTIFAKIENAKFLISTGKYEEVYLFGNQTEESKRNVSKKIIPKTPAATDNGSKEGILEASSKSIENLGKLIEGKTPDIVGKSIISTSNTIESFRENIGNFSENSKEEIKKELAEIKSEKTGSENAGSANKLEKPFKYVKLFLLSLVSFIFNNKFVFYGLSVLIAFFLLRYIWRLVF